MENVNRARTSKMTDICPCLVSQPPVSPDFRRGVEGPSPVLVSLFLLLYFHSYYEDFPASYFYPSSGEPRPYIALD